MPVSQRSPPLQPPVAHEFGPGFTEKLHSVLPHILPAVQSYGTVNVSVAPEACSQPVGWDGTDFPALRSVYRAGLEDLSADCSYGHGLQPHQIVKGQWFVTVKVRNDPGPAFPEMGLGIGVDDVEVGFSNDVAVTARAATLRLREQTFILVAEMDAGLQAVLLRPFSPHGWSRSTATTKGGDAHSLSRDPSPNPSECGTREDESRENPTHGCISIKMTGRTRVGELNTKEFDVLQCHTSHNFLASLSSSPVTPAASNSVQISLARLLSSRRRNA